MEPSVSLDPVGLDDLELLLAWRSNPRIYEHFRRQDGPLEWGAHVEWFANRDPDRRDWVIRYNGRRVGAVYVTTNDEIGVYVGETSAWGQGIAKAALEAAVNRIPDRRPLTAQIHEDNDTSQQLFVTVGFKQHARDGDWFEYRYTD